MMVVVTYTGTLCEESDAAVATATEVVLKAKRTLRRTVGSATESLSVHGGGRTGDDSDTEGAPAATSHQSGAASGSAKKR